MIHTLSLLSFLCVLLSELLVLEYDFSVEDRLFEFVCSEVLTHGTSNATHIGILGDDTTVVVLLENNLVSEFSAEVGNEGVLLLDSCHSMLTLRCFMICP